MTDIFPNFLEYNNPISQDKQKFFLGLWSLHYQFMNVIIKWLAKILEEITCGYGHHVLKNIVFIMSVMINPIFSLMITISTRDIFQYFCQTYTNLSITYHNFQIVLELNSMVGLDHHLAGMLVLSNHFH